MPVQRSLGSLDGLLSVLLLSEGALVEGALRNGDEVLVIEAMVDHRGLLLLDFGRMLDFADLGSHLCRTSTHCESRQRLSKR